MKTTIALGFVALIAITASANAEVNIDQKSLPAGFKVVGTVKDPDAARRCDASTGRKLVFSSRFTTLKNGNRFYEFDSVPDTDSRPRAR